MSPGAHKFQVRAVVADLVDPAPPQRAWTQEARGTPPACAAGQTGTPPNCVTPTCAAGQTGAPPNCVTPTCATGQTGTPPNCVTPTCPAGQTGTPPNCVTPPPASITQYSCPSVGNDIGHYVPPNRYWEQNFTAQSGYITGGGMGLGANQDGGDHRAKIGVYTASNRGGPLEEIIVAVDGYGGVNFTFPTPIAVSAGQQLWFTATGVGDFTAYDQNSAGHCTLGHLDGHV